MKIVSIFAPRLFAFHYSGEKFNELQRLLNLWNDPVKLMLFIKDNRSDIGNISDLDLVEQLIDDAETIDEEIKKYKKNTKISLNEFFKPLVNSEYQLVDLSRQKKRQNHFRLYAIKIDDDCFVITGGGIKFPKVHLMEDRAHLSEELGKLEKCKAFLKSQGIFDNDSFFEFLNENL